MRLKSDSYESESYDSNLINMDQCPESYDSNQRQAESIQFTFDSIRFNSINFCVNRFDSNQVKH